MGIKACFYYKYNYFVFYMYVLTWFYKLKRKKLVSDIGQDVQEGYRSYSDDVFEEEPDEYRLNVFWGVYCGTSRGWLRRVSFRRERLKSPALSGAFLFLRISGKIQVNCHLFTIPIAFCKIISLTLS